MKTLNRILAALLLAACWALVMCSCTVTVSPDGSKSVTIDGEQAIRAIEILNQK